MPPSNGTTNNLKALGWAVGILLTLLVSVIGAWSSDQHSRIVTLETSSNTTATDVAVLKQSLLAIDKKLEKISEQLERQTSCSTAPR